MENLGNILNLLQTIAVVTAAIVAIVGIKSWRRELLGKRRSEIAEQAIVTASSVKDALIYVRNPFGFKGEGQSRNRINDENENTLEILDQDFVPIERMNKFLDDFSQLKSTKLLCKAHFGDEAIESFDELLRIRSEIISAAQFRMMISGGNGGHSERSNELYVEREKLIWDQYEKDEINPRIEKAVSDIEEYYGKYLKL